MSFLTQKIKGLFNLLLNRPVLLIFNVTRQCNQKCLMCNIPQNTTNITLDEISALAKKFKKFGICEVYLQGGEPLLRADIIGIVDIFIKNSIKPSIISNGELLNLSLKNEIAKRNCNLYISIDSFIPEIYSKLRGKNSLQKVIDNLKLFSSLPRPKGIVAITSTITNFSTIEDFKNIAEFCTKMNFSYYVRPYNYNLDKAGAKADELICDNKKTIEIIEYFNHSKITKNILYSVVYEENVKFLKGKRYKYCDAMKYSIVLNEDGKISPCIEHTDIRFDIDDYNNQYRKLEDIIKNCNDNTPCIYGCTRNVGFIRRNRFQLFIKMFKLAKIRRNK